MIYNRGGQFAPTDTKTGEVSRLGTDSVSPLSKERCTMQAGSKTLSSEVRRRLHAEWIRAHAQEVAQGLGLYARWVIDDIEQER